MKKKLEGYRRYLYFGIIIIALGVTFSSAMQSNFGSLGIVFIAIGGPFFIIAMSKKRKEEEQKND